MPRQINKKVEVFFARKPGSGQLSVCKSGREATVNELIDDIFELLDLSTGKISIESVKVIEYVATGLALCKPKCYEIPLEDISHVKNTPVQGTREVQEHS